MARPYLIILGLVCLDLCLELAPDIIKSLLVVGPFRVLELHEALDFALELLDLSFQDSTFVVLVLNSRLKHMNVLGLVGFFF